MEGGSFHLFSVEFRMILHSKTERSRFQQCVSGFERAVSGTYASGEMTTACLPNASYAASTSSLEYAQAFAAIGSLK